MEYYELMAGQDPYIELPGEVLDDPDFPESHGLPHINEPDGVDDSELSSDDWTDSSEADYFYTDGHGNVYPVETHAVPETDEVGWLSTPQLVESEGFNHGEMEIYGDENANQTYIMYHEVQQWCPASGALRDAAGQAWPLSHLDEPLPFARSVGEWPAANSQSCSGISSTDLIRPNMREQDVDKSSLPGLSLRQHQTAENTTSSL
jgi:hypothetical protein